MREFHKQKDAKTNEIAKGDFVLIQEDKVKRGCWKTGVVEELITEKDGVVPGTKVRKAGSTKGTLNRSLLKLLPLEIACPGYNKKRGMPKLNPRKK